MSDTNMTDYPAKAGTWLLRLLILCVPVANVVASLLWGFGGRDAVTRGFGRAAFAFILLASAVLASGGLLAANYLLSAVLAAG
ncbi:MAG: hypothetical protein A2087_04360 [Spirochaetes bacterium GWD1_61_31]|nr:MAG: hypothetical protein A2Y37_10925 [Spirochaetes bacterium GWB1_60_80]OHD33716.1 MAG: hypothetical protein A2004_09770 [Spirochaetes bacterium GWC1_61_12]OHD35442.1 MAG: hypothetical protein A2087_04360 [Spirochaetes bacterium GWD1_61_31]OHD44951.1 MAG: hypothetical protein A2Y35_12965 [Spirochaetes bacterium GWE1_60_18]OHD60061.1 MAG: hypothetical protein A2Y32_11080 [Spirochaetes bacterium GWF1_60_12]HAP43620.1 hypothetical protein [Spirochaetaceae bacterium]